MPATFLARALPILLLIGSNILMTFAWYGHLKFKDKPLLAGILVSWGINVYSAAQLKGMQEVITLAVFAAFSILYLGQKITLNHLIGFALIAAGAFFLFRAPIA